MQYQGEKGLGDVNEEEPQQNSNPRGSHSKVPSVCWGHSANQLTPVDDLWEAYHGAVHIRL